MSKIKYLNKVLLGCIGAAAFTFSAFGQTASLQSDLNHSFTKYKLTHIDVNAARRNAQNRESVTISTARGDYELNLQPHDLRTSSFRAEATGGEGNYPLEKSAVTTFKGKVSGETVSDVRVNIDGANVEGYFSIADGEKYFIEAASHFSKNAAADEYVVFKAQDFTKKRDFSCLSEIGEKMERGKEIVSSAPAVNTAATMRVLEIATEADYAFVNEFGGAAQANNQILGILNLIEGDFEHDLNLSFDVVFQHAWTGADPYNASTANTALNSFQAYWNANYPTTVVPRDLAHIWTSRSNFAGIGLSNLRTVCRAPASAYGLSGRFDYELIQYVLSAHEIGHSLNASHVDGAQTCDNTIMNATISNLTPLSFCPFSRGEVNNFVASYGDCLSERTLSAKTAYDYDGDGKADISVFRSSNGAWYLNRTSAGFAGSVFGQAGDKIAPADYDGDGKTDLAVFRSGSWYIQRSADGFTGFGFGQAGDIPVPADFDGDGKADAAVFRPSNGTWYIQGSRSGFTAAAFGQLGDVPVPADFDGDGKTDINVFRPLNGAWYRINSSNNQFYGATFGQLGDKPLAADFDGDGKADLTVYRPSNGGWYRVLSANNMFAADAFGVATDVPTPADFDGDGKTDIAVYRPSNGYWYRYNSRTGEFVNIYFGLNTDLPTQACLLQ